MMKQSESLYNLELAARLDASDALGHFRERFVQSAEGMIYLDGNSLGKLPKDTIDVIDNTVKQQWGQRLIRSWNDEWIDLSERIARKIAKLIGAAEDEVMVTDSTSLNLFKLAYGALKLQHDKSRIVSDNLNFPSDLYVLQGLVNLFGQGHRLVLAESYDAMTISDDSLLQAIDGDTALVALTHVCFKSAFMYDMKRVTRMAHDAGALMLWDLSHAAGAVPVFLNESGADMAVGCTYKYLNGGPGSIAFLYVRRDLQDRLVNPVWGWFADDKPFDFNLNFTPAVGIRKFQTSTPPVISVKSVEPGVDLILEAGIENLRAKSLGLSKFFIDLFEMHLLSYGFTLGSPKDDAIRGSHISIRHPEAYRICQALIRPLGQKPAIIPDFRSPDNIRIGFTPLYNSYSEVAVLVNRLTEIVLNNEYQDFTAARSKVT